MVLPGVLIYFGFYFLVVCFCFIWLFVLNLFEVLFFCVLIFWFGDLSNLAPAALEKYPASSYVTGVHDRTFGGQEHDHGPKQQ